MQVCVDWGLIISGTQVTKKTRLVRSVFPDYCYVYYDYEIMNVNIRISRFEISRYFVRCDLDDERLPQLYLELFDAYKKRFMSSEWTSRCIKVLSNMAHKIFL